MRRPFRTLDRRRLWLKVIGRLLVLFASCFFFCFFFLHGVTSLFLGFLRCPDVEIAPFTPGDSISRVGREHWFSSDVQLSKVAPRPFLRHTLVTASASGRNLVRGWYFSNYQFYETWTGDWRHDRNTAKRNVPGRSRPGSATAAHPL